MTSLFEAIAQAQRMIRESELVIVMHPDDVTDEVREKVAAVPLTTLQESSIIERGKAYVMRPGALEALGRA